MNPGKLIPKLTFNKTLGGLDLFCIATGAMISSGIFVLPGVAFKNIGPAVFLSYGVAGIAAMVGALAVIELATAMPKAGGDYYFIERSLGPGIGTISGILSWLALMLKSSFAAYGLGAVAQEMFGLDLVMVASITIVIFLVVNLIGTREAASMEVLMVGAMLVIMFGYIALCTPQIQVSRYQPFIFAGKSVDAIFAVAAMVFVSYGGLLSAVSVAEEVKLPRRSIPVGMLSSIAVVTLIYVLILIVTVGALPGDDLAGSLTPLADTAKRYFGMTGYILITAAAVFAFTTTVNAGIMSASRYPVAMSRDQLLPRILSRTYGKKEIPIPAIIATAILLLVSVRWPLETLVKAASAVIMSSYVLINLAVIILRESKIRNYRPTFIAPGYPYLQIVCMIGFIILIVHMGAEVMKLCAAIIAVALVVFLICGRRVRREYALMHLVERITNRQLTDHHLESELREVIRTRDEIVEDEFDKIVRASEMLLLEDSFDRDQFFRRVAGEFAPVLHLEPDEIQRLLLERESESSTIIAPGVALPHLIVPGENIFSLFVIKSETGIVFDEDQDPVRAVFVLAGSRDRRNFHLKALAAIAQIISDPEFEKRWRALTNPEQMRDALLLGSRKRHTAA